MDIFPFHNSESLSSLAGRRPDGVIVCLPLDQDDDGLTPEAILDRIREMHRDLPVAFLRTDGPANEAVRLLRRGATDYFDCAETAGQWIPQKPERAKPDEPWRRFLVGCSPAMLPVFDTIRLLGPRRSTVLIQGETGSGKELVARAIHAASPRAVTPMVPVNCSALPDTLLEAELFGHVRGAFTGALQARVGRFEQAQRGSIFLDEIGDLPLDIQVKLLRVLQEREFQRLGSGESVKLDVRVIAATNANLEQRIEAGKFREDLFYRLNVVSIFLPPLRDRWQDIPLLAEHFVEKICQVENLPPKQIEIQTLEELQRFAWPGNVRQLENMIERAIILSGERQTLFPADFRLPRAELSRRTSEVSASVSTIPEQGMDLQQTVQSLERVLIEQALRRTRGNKSQAADILGLKRTTLSAKLKVLEAAAAM